MKDDVVAVQFPSVVLRLGVCRFLDYPTRSCGSAIEGPGGAGRIRGWPQPGHGIVGTVRGLGRNRARRYRRINNTGSRSYVKRPPCYARRYCHRRWVRSTGGAGKRKGERAGCRRYVLPTATCSSVQRGRGAHHFLHIYLHPSSALIPLFSIFVETLTKTLSSLRRRDISLCEDRKQRTR